MLATQKTQTANNLLIDLFFLTITLGIFYAVWIGSYALFTPDEGRYSEVAREMVVTGDFITPRLNGVAFLDKPVLYYWLQASAIKLFGLTEWSLRFWPALIGVLGCIVTYIGGRFLFNRRVGIISAIILATNPLYYGGSHYANLDLEVAVFISNSLLFFILGMQAQTKSLRTIFLMLAYFFAGLAVLTKGLIGLVFPAMIIGAWILILNRWQILTRMQIFFGLVIFLSITAPWYWLVQKANPHFFDFFFITQQFSRFLTKADFNNKTGIWFYIPLVLAGLVPWSVFLCQALAHHVKLIWQNRQKYSSELFITLWFILIFMFFSIPKSKTIGYILPIFPALALIIGNYLSTYWDNLKSNGIYVGKVIFILSCWILSIICLAIPLLHLFNIDKNLNTNLMIVSIILFIAGMTAYFLRKKPFIKTFNLFTLTSVLFLLVVIASASVINSKTVKPLAMLIKTKLQADDEVITYYRYYQDLPIYLERRITIVANWHAENIARYDNWQRELWFNMPYQDTSAWLIEDEKLWERWSGNKRLFVIMYQEFYPDFLKKLRNHTKNAMTFQIGFQSIGEHDQLILISNKES